MKVIIITAPSGSGKTTLAKKLISDIPNATFSISATTRDPRKNEINGKDYHFISKELFKSKIKNNEFIEYEEVYNGNYYGTLKSEIKRLAEEKKVIIFDVEVKGALNLKNYFKENALSLFIQVPSIEELKKRIVARKSETPESLEKRLARAEFEFTYKDKFDSILLNTDLKKAENEIVKIVSNFIK